MKYAHSTEEKQNKSSWQTLPDHFAGVTELAEGFASPFRAEPWARAAGLLHDIGKVSAEFQRRLEKGLFSCGSRPLWACGLKQI